MTRVHNLIAIIFLTISCYGQEYNFINYGVRDGLPQSDVHDIVQDSNTYMWFATYGGGVASFDGDIFYSLTTSDGLPSNFVNCLQLDGHDIWIGTSNGFCRVRNRHIDLIRSFELEVLDIHKNLDSAFWIGTAEGVYSFDPESGQLRKESLNPKLDRSRINKIFQFNSVTWFATEVGLFKYEERTTEEIIFDNSNSNLTDIAMHEDLIILAKYGEGIIVLRKDQENRVIDLLSKKASLNFAKELMVVNKELWVGTEDNGLAVYNFDTQSWNHIDEEDGLAYNNVSSFWKDRSGKIWIGTSGGGVDKLIGRNFDHLSKNNGLKGSRVHSVLSDENGTLWLSLDRSGVTIINDDQIQHNIDGDLITTKCTHIYQDAFGSIWLSTEGQGIFKLDSTGYTSFTTESGLQSNYIRCSVMDEDGTMWVATYDRGISKIYKPDSVINHIFTCSDIVAMTLMTLVKDQNGLLWFGTSTGLIGNLSESQTNCFSHLNGVPKVPVNSIAFDRLNNMWVGTAGAGIFKGFEQSGTYVFEEIEDNYTLLSRNINFLNVDTQGTLWAGSELGLDQLSINASGFINEITHYGQNDGFLGLETSHNASAFDKNGNLLIGTMNGLMTHYTRGAKDKNLVPLIHFQDTYVNHQILSSSGHKKFVKNNGRLVDDISFTYDQRDFSFSYKGIDLDVPEGIRYSWRLIPLDTLWSRFSDATTANFSSLQFGKYSFQVKAINKYGHESRVVRQDFTIEAPFWKRIWFYALCLCFASAFAYLLYSIRISKIRKKEKVKISELKIKNELLALEQKAMQLQMNPHFIFNALNSIQGLVVRQKTDLAREQMQTFASLMRGLLQNSKLHRISLQDEYETLEKYLNMEQFCQPKRFEYTIQLPDEHLADEIEIPSMMIQPFVENAIIHGLAHSDREGQVDIKFLIKDELLSCSIRDNGVGRTRAKELSVKSSKSHESTALDITKRRLEAIRKERKYNCFSISDILKEKKVVGTEVVITIPLEVSY